MHNSCGKSCHTGMITIPIINNCTLNIQIYSALGDIRYSCYCFCYVTLQLSSLVRLLDGWSYNGALQKIICCMQTSLTLMTYFFLTSVFSHQFQYKFTWPLSYMYILRPISKHISIFYFIFTCHIAFS